VNIHSFISVQLTRAIQVVFTTLLLLTSPLSLAHDKGHDVSTASAWEFIEQGAVVIDVRTAEEFAAGHLEGATNIPFEDIVTGVGQLKLAKDSKILLYCRSGRRSGIAQESLIAAGYSGTLNGGGYDTLAAKPDKAN
jgi:phage shock protein E